jgi:hypothetical protein
MAQHGGLVLGFWGTKGASINSIKPTMASQNAAKKRSIDGYVSIFSRVLTQ